MSGLFNGPALTGHEPRASRIVVPDRYGILHTELWMGGADTGMGEALHPHHLTSAWVVDCAGDMPPPHREAAALWLYRVFADTEETPPAWRRIDTLTASLAACLRGHPPAGDWEHPAAPPARLYVVCKQGLNRSGLVMGRLLGALGVPGGEAHDLVQRHRPGALNNLTFARLVRDDRPAAARRQGHHAGA